MRERDTEKIVKVKAPKIKNFDGFKAKLMELSETTKKAISLAEEIAQYEFVISTNQNED